MKRMNVFFLAAMAVAVSLPGFAEGLPKAKPEQVGLSSERLEVIGETMEANVQAGLTSGALGMIARKGKVAYFDVRGMADREKKQAMTKDTIFRIYSMSKPIVSTGLMMMYEEGKFLLNDPVSKYIPELGGLPIAVPEKSPERGGPVFNLPDRDDPNPPAAPVGGFDIETVPAYRDMTIHDLLRHTAGLTYGFFGNTKVDRAYQQSGILVFDKDLEDMVGKLGKIPLQYQPGSRWHYSVAVDVQGRLIEVLSGQPLDEYLAERIFKPLNMVDTGFYVPEDKMHRFAQMYSPDGNGGIVPADPNLSRNYVNPPTLFSGGGGLVSTASDYLRFCQMHLNGGVLDGTRILSRKTTELMSTDHLGDLQMGNGGYGFGLGFAVAKDMGRIGALGSVGEYNWGGAAGTKFWIDPEEEMIGIYMVQILPHTGLNYGVVFKNLAYQSIVD